MWFLEDLCLTPSNDVIHYAPKLRWIGKASHFSGKEITESISQCVWWDITTDAEIVYGNNRNQLSKGKSDPSSPQWMWK